MFGSFFGRIDDDLICFRDLVTFNEAGLSTILPRLSKKVVFYFFFSQLYSNIKAITILWIHENYKSRNVGSDYSEQKRGL